VTDIRIAPARREDVPAILRLIEALAAYEKLAHQMVATEADLRDAMFGERASVEVVLAFAETLTSTSTPIGFALFFHNFSTFLGRPGLYLEDLFVVPEWRGRGVGRRLLAHLAQLAVQRNCGRMEWSVLDWNEPALGFYRRLGAAVMEDWRICRLTGDALVRVAESSRG
jgi:GNAT superfamily N-acetyltransferase